MSGTLQELFARKSVRVYENRPIAQTEKEAILRASLEAPTAGNMTMFTILDITDQSLKEQLVTTCDNQPFIAKAPLVLVFLADYQRWYDAYCYEQAEGEPPRLPDAGDLMLAACDALIAAQNAVVAAESLGIGSCYIGDILENFEQHQKLFRLPKYAIPVAMLCFGYPTKQQEARIKPARFDSKYIVHENTYSQADRDTLCAAFTDRAQRAGKPDYSYPQEIRAMMKRKYQSDFSREMSRSVHAMLKSWCSGKKKKGN